MYKLALIAILSIVSVSAFAEQKIIVSFGGPSAAALYRAGVEMPEATQSKRAVLSNPDSAVYVTRFRKFGNFVCYFARYEDSEGNPISKVIQPENMHCSGVITDTVQTN